MRTKIRQFSGSLLSMVGRLLKRATTKHITGFKVEVAKFWEYLRWAGRGARRASAVLAEKWLAFGVVYFGILLIGWLGLGFRYAAQWTATYIGTTGAGGFLLSFMVAVSILVTLLVAPMFLALGLVSFLRAFTWTRRTADWLWRRYTAPFDTGDTHPTPEHSPDDELIADTKATAKDQAAWGAIIHALTIPIMVYIDRHTQQPLHTVVTGMDFSVFSDLVSGTFVFLDVEGILGVFMESIGVATTIYATLLFLVSTFIFCFAAKNWLYVFEANARNRIQATAETPLLSFPRFKLAGAFLIVTYFVVAGVWAVAQTA